MRQGVLGWSLYLRRLRDYEWPPLSSRWLEVDLSPADAAKVLGVCEADVMTVLDLAISKERKLDSACRI